jgi:OOP family OmpA-OmpF porin
LSLGFFADYDHVEFNNSDNGHIITPTLALTWYFGANSEAREMKKDVTEKVQAEIAETQTTYSGPADIDADGDGVNDKDDKCLSTKKGAKVNALGCAVDEKATISINVEFGSGKLVIDSKFNDHLKEVAAFLNKHSDINVQIEGYTDNSGLTASNIRLSDARAKSVAAALAKLGVDKKRLTAKGFGPENPIADNSTVEGRQANRRVVAVLTTK